MNNNNNYVYSVNAFVDWFEKFKERMYLQMEENGGQNIIGISMFQGDFRFDYIIDIDSLEIDDNDDKLTIVVDDGKMMMEYDLIKEDVSIDIVDNTNDDLENVCFKINYKHNMYFNVVVLM